MSQKIEVKAEDVISVMPIVEEGYKANIFKEIENHDADVEIDFSNIKIVSSKTIQDLLKSYKVLEKRKRSLKIKNVNASVYEIFERLSFNKLFSYSLLSKSNHSQNKNN